MRRSFSPLLVAGLFCVGGFAPQDPVPGKPAPSRYEGVYRLTSRVVDGRTDPTPHHGFLAITTKHLFLTLAARGVHTEYPLTHSSVRQWREEQGSMRTVIDIDVWTDGGGNIHLEPAGTEERRRFELVRGGIRVLQDDRTWLEFERIE